MRCRCGAKLRTIATRLMSDGGIRRRRECPDCGRRISTVETPVEDRAQVKGTVQ